MNMQVGTKFYSCDDESFQHREIDDALQELEDDGNLRVGAVIYEGAADRKAPSSYLRVDYLLDQLSDSAYDDSNHSTDDPFDLPKPKREELERLIGAWLDANITREMWLLRDIRPVTVTAEMLAEHGRAAQAQEGGAS